MDEDEMMQICLGGLAQRYGPIRTAICTREKPLTFFDLQSMLMVEENHTSASWSTHSDNQMLYTETNRPRGCGECGGSARNGDGGQEQNQRHNRQVDNSFRPSTSRGSQGDTGTCKGRPRRTVGIAAREAREKECWKKKADLD